ncbi:hypothetical protein JOE38_000958 [Clavibacter michiganensis]|uniref:hypothetical protein n=1 Tax=Clavibacter michiganensis TaxID=28447 RepID=UPI00195D8EED|nr:hypothetical protein [Clavibacter michiganensis]MBM7411135.1 hypothetical protein [Clavibacter michiganensis]
MNPASVPDRDRVLADLGDPFVQSFIAAVDGARDDFAEFRAWQPGWFPGFTARFTADFLHERIWARLIREVDGMEGITIRDREPVRELRSGTMYLLRIKRHHLDDRISAYPTEASRAFWGGTTLTLEGLESVPLALGYYWDAEMRSVGDAVLSYRDGTDSPVWAVRLRREAASSRGFAWEPVSPEMPELDLRSVLDDDTAADGTAS